MHAVSELDTLFGMNAGVEGMFDQAHLGHGVGNLDQFCGGLAAGEDQMHPGRLFINDEIGNFKGSYDNEQDD